MFSIILKIFIFIQLHQVLVGPRGISCRSTASCGSWVSLLWATWDLNAWTSDWTESPALQGRFRITRPPGKSQYLFCFNTIYTKETGDWIRLKAVKQRPPDGTEITILNPNYFRKFGGESKCSFMTGPIFAFTSLVPKVWYICNQVLINK